MLLTRKLRRSFQLVVIALTAIASLVAMGGTAQAAAAPLAGTYSGNYCLNARWYIDNAGAEACAFQNAASPGNWVTISTGAYDYAPDGLSAKTNAVLQQWNGSGWVSTNNLPTVVNSAGYGTTKVSGSVIVYRQSGMSFFRLWIRACTYDAPTAVHRSCAAKYTSAINWYS